MILIIFFSIIVFFSLVYFKWTNDNDLMIIHVEKDFNEKYQYYLIKKVNQNE